jgi:tRNA(Ile2) C34 agmatinyltransferase TiaS
MSYQPESKETTCPNCGGDAEWNGDSNIDCDECGEIETELVGSEPYVVEHRLDGEVIDQIELEA